MIRCTYDQKVLTAGLLVGVTVLAGVGLASTTVVADDVVDLVNITVPISCSLSGTNLLHTAEIRNGQYDDEIGSANIAAFCNDTSGFAIYAVGFTGDVEGNNKLSDATLGSDYDIITGKYVQGETTNSVWAMKLTPVSGIYTPTIRSDEDYDYTDFELVPDNYTRVVSYDAATDAGVGAMGSHFTTNYAVYVSEAQAAGTYTGQVKFTLVHPENAPAPMSPLKPTDCPAESICYAPNADDIEGSMSSIGSLSAAASGGKQSASVNSEVALISANYKRDGYGLAGWSPVYNATPGTDTVYGPNETISTNPSNGGVDISTQGLILYPVWIASAGDIQDWTGCSSMSTGAVTALTDKRDNNVYTVAKLADGNCWMTENLRLNADKSGNASLAEGYGSGFTGLPNSEDANFNSSTANNLYDTGNTYTMPRYNNNNTNIGGKNSAGTDLVPGYSNSGNNVQWYSYGNYYTWAAAIADVTAHNNNNEPVEGTSLCPAGWHLPTSGNKSNATNNNFLKLGIALTGAEPANTSSQTYPYYTGNPEGTNASKAYRSFPNNFLYSGAFVGSSAYGRSSNGYYWSRSASNSNGAYSLRFSDSDVYPSSNNGKDNGFSVRCLASS